MAETVIASTLLGCVGCQAGMEYLQTVVKDSLNLVTFVTFSFTALHGLVFHSKFFSVANRVPISSYVSIVAICFVVNMSNNYAMKFDVYFPLFIIFKSGTLIANMSLGYLLRGYRYSFKQICAVLVVTSGIVIFTLASYEPRGTTFHRPTDVDWMPVPPFFVGITLLLVALFLSAYLGLYQETFYQKHGKHSEEMMFYVHFLSIPVFALIGDEIFSAWRSANTTPSFVYASYDTHLPLAWVIILGICFFQFLCTRSVYKLSSVTSSLNVTMVLTMRKFLSLFISFVFFGNDFNLFHALGAAFVLMGSFLFSFNF